MNQGKVDSGGQFNYTYQWSQQLSWVNGKHEYQSWAGTSAACRPRATTGPAPTALTSSAAIQTADPANKNATGNAFASMLLGAVDSASQTTLPVVIGQIRYGYHAGFFQDDWRITPRLTLNYGVRYEVPIGWHSRDGNYSNLDITKPNPGAGGLPGALVYRRRRVRAVPA